MLDREISIRAMIRHLEGRRMRGAMKAVESGGTYETFLIQTGKFRENRSLIQYLEEMIGDDEPRETVDDEQDDPEENEEGEDPPQPVVEPKASRPRRVKPRGWGGG